MRLISSIRSCRVDIIDFDMLIIAWKFYVQNGRFFKNNSYIGFCVTALTAKIRWRVLFYLRSLHDAETCARTRVVRAVSVSASSRGERNTPPRPNRRAIPYRSPRGCAWACTRVRSGPGTGPVVWATRCTRTNLWPACTRGRTCGTVTSWAGVWCTRRSCLVWRDRPTGWRTVLSPRCPTRCHA